MSAFYGLFALTAGVVEALRIASFALEARPRAAPGAFVVHSISGAVALMAGCLQLNPRLRASRLVVHRRMGLLYAASTALTSVSGVRVTLAFEVTSASKLMFLLALGAWAATTAIGFAKVRTGDVAAHRAWMVRSYALALFFVTFSIWLPATMATGLAGSVAHPLSILLSWAGNLGAAEAFLRTAERGGLLGPGPGLRVRGRDSEIR